MNQGLVVNQEGETTVVDVASNFGEFAVSLLLTLLERQVGNLNLRVYASMKFVCPSAKRTGLLTARASILSNLRELQSKT